MKWRVMNRLVDALMVGAEAVRAAPPLIRLPPEFSNESEPNSLTHLYLWLYFHNIECFVEENTIFCDDRKLLIIRDQQSYNIYKKVTPTDPDSELIERVEFETPNMLAEILKKVCDNITNQNTLEFIKDHCESHGFQNVRIIVSWGENVLTFQPTSNTNVKIQKQDNDWWVVIWDMQNQFFRFDWTINQLLSQLVSKVWYHCVPIIWICEKLMLQRIITNWNQVTDNDHQHMILHYNGYNVAFDEHDQFGQEWNVVIGPGNEEIQHVFNLVQIDNGALSVFLIDNCLLIDSDNDNEVLPQEEVS